MILDHQVEQILQEQITLILGHTKYAMREALVDIHALPASHRVGADNGVNGGEFIAIIERTAASTFA
jgi:hypothetical protein